MPCSTQPQEPMADARVQLQRGMSAPIPGFGPAGACWGTRTNPASLMLGLPSRGGLGPAERTRRSSPRSQNYRRPLERRRLLGYWRISWQPRRRQGGDGPPCVGIMRRCGPLKISDGLGLSSNSRTRALCRLRPGWASTPICPLWGCAPWWRELSCSLVHCRWLVWQYSVGFCGSGLIKFWLASRGCIIFALESRIRRRERRGGSHNHSPHGRMDSGMPYSDGPRPRDCEQATICFLWAVRGWSTSSWRSRVQRLGGTAGGMLCEGVATLRVTLANPRCSSSSGGGGGTVLARPCDMRQRSKMLRSWALFDCLWRREQGRRSGCSRTWRFGLPICSPQKLSPCPRLHFTPPPPPGLTQMYRWPRPQHHQRPPGVVQNWSTLQCSMAKH